MELRPTGGMCLLIIEVNMKKVLPMSLSLFCAAVLQTSSQSFGRDLAVQWRWQADETNQRFQPGPLITVNKRLFCCVAQFTKTEQSKLKMEFHLWEFDSTGQRVRDILLHSSDHIMDSPLPSRVACFASSKAGQLYVIVRQSHSPPLLIKTSDTLEVVYKKPLITKNADFNTIQLLPNGNFVLTGHDDSKGVLVELSPLGDAIRTKEFSKEIWGCNCSDLRLSTSNNFLLAMCSDGKVCSVSIHKLDDKWDVLKSAEIAIPDGVYLNEILKFQFAGVSSNGLALLGASRENGNRKHTVKTYNTELETTTEVSMNSASDLLGFCQAKPFDNDTFAVLGEERAAGVTLYLLHNNGQEETHLKITDRCSDIHSWIESSDGHLWLVTRTCGEDEAVGRVSVFAIEVKK